MGNKQSDHKVTPIVINFGAQPTTHVERKVVADFEKTLGKLDNVMNLLRNYSGCQFIIKEAFDNPSDETTSKAWNSVLKCVEDLEKFYSVSQKLDNDFVRGFKMLCQEGNIQTNIQENQCLVLQLSRMFYLSFKTDEYKMLKPTILNDFAYFKRTSVRMAKGGALASDTQLIHAMSLFLAYPTPLIRVFISSVQNQVGEIPLENLVQCFSLLGNVCAAMVSPNMGIYNESEVQLLSLMTGCLILVDHIDPLGAFHKRALIRSKLCVSLLIRGRDDTMYLVNSLRASAVHLNEKHTNSDVQRMLMF